MIGFSTVWQFRNEQDYFTPFWENNIFDFELLHQHNIPTSWIGNATPLKISNLLVTSSDDTISSKACNISSEIESERQSAIQTILQACSKAMALKTSYVVIELGSVSFLSPQKETRPSPEQWKIRCDIASSYLERICRGLFYIAKQYPDIKLCILPARTWQGLPHLEEIDIIRSDLSRYNIQYWHNAAYVHALEKIGLPGQEEWLTKYGHCMSGLHVEDIFEGQMLYPPGLGEIQWDTIRKHFPSKIIKVLRLHSRFDMQTIMFSYRYLYEHL